MDEHEEKTGHVVEEHECPVCIELENRDKRQLEQVPKSVWKILGVLYFMRHPIIATKELIKTRKENTLQEGSDNDR